MAAGWFDFDRDGLLDLWIVHYAKWSPAENRFCGDANRGIRIYCHPKYFEPLPTELDRLKLPRRLLEMNNVLDPLCTSNFMLVDFAAALHSW